MIDTGVILAAGLGSRLQKIYSKKPKGFLELGNSTLIERSIQLLSNNGIKKIIIVTGHLFKHYNNLETKNIICIQNPNYFDTGSFHSLMMTINHLSKDFLLLESDLLYEEKALKIILSHKKNNVILASDMTNSNDEVFIEVDDCKYLKKISKKPNRLKNIYAELVGINKISIDTMSKLKDWSIVNQNIALNCHYEEVFQEVRENRFYVEKVNKLIWTEIDNENHYLRAINDIYPKILEKENEK